MTIVDFVRCPFPCPCSTNPPGVFRVGQSRVLLELVLRAFNRGESREGIVRSYPAPRLADVYAVIRRYLANPAPFDDYLHLCGEQAAAVRREVETAQGPGVSKKELMARARAKGLVATAKCVGKIIVVRDRLAPTVNVAAGPVAASAD